MSHLDFRPDETDAVHDAVRRAYAVDANDQTDNIPYASVRHSCPHARHETAHIESGASFDPHVSVLCVWRFPPPKGSRSVRHEPHATHGHLCGNQPVRRVHPIILH